MKYAILVVVTISKHLSLINKKKTIEKLVKFIS